MHLLQAAWANIEQDGPAAVMMAAQAVVEVVDRTLRALAPEDEVLAAAAAGHLSRDAVYPTDGTTKPTRVGRLAFALRKSRPADPKLVAAQAGALSKTLSFVIGELQGAKHNGATSTVALVRTYLVSAEAFLVQLLEDPDGD